MPLMKMKSWSQFLKVCFLSFIFCGTIVLGNASLKYLPVSFTQAIGSTTPFFTAILAYVFMGTRESLLTYLTLIPIMSGIAIASGGEPLFHMVGFLFCMTATAGRALKSVTQSLLMSDPAEKLDPM
jgi:drug/metabolite transporter (DMT)-like permease